VWTFEPFVLPVAGMSEEKDSWLGRYETFNRDAYSCPSCGSDDRCRMFALYMPKYFARGHTDRAASVLDIAPSQCLSILMRDALRVWHCPVVYRTADLVLPWVDDRVDITNMQCYRDEMFDFFICSHVLEHVPDDRGALRELYRVLKPGGEGLMMVPIRLDLDAIDEDFSAGPAERRRRFGAEEHVRMYSRQGFVRRVQDAGFKVEQYGVSDFGANLFRRCGIDPGSILYVAAKPLFVNSGREMS